MALLDRYSTHSIPALAEPLESGRLSVAMIGLRGIPATHGGVEHAVEHLSVELAELGHDVTVYARKAYSDIRTPEHQGVHLRYVGQIDTKHLEAASHTLLSVLHAIRSRHYDVVHIHASGPALFSFLPRMAGIATVVTVHGEDWRRAKWGRLAQAALRTGLRVAATVPDRTIVVSQELQRHLRATYGAHTAHIPNGIDASQFADTEPLEELTADPFVLFLGRLVPEKGVHTLLRAFARTDLDHRLVIAGPGTHTSDYVAELEALAAQDPRVELLGPVYGRRKSWLLNNASLFVQPSTLEGMPIALLEAAACGRPCLVSDIPEHLEVISSNKSRLAATFAAGDEADLALALERAFCLQGPPDPGPLRERVIEDYRWPNIARTTEAVYREAMAAHAATSP